MKNIAILTSKDMMPGGSDLREDVFELTEQMNKITPAFAAKGLSAELVLWNDAGRRAREFEAMLPLFVWDYFVDDNARLFLEQMRQASAITKVFNIPAVLNWNSDKSYLADLAAKGAPVIDSVTVEAITLEIAKRAFEDFDCEALVIKPEIGGGAWRQALYHKGEPWPHAAQLPPSAAIVQPFLPSVQNEGEYSFIYFDGEFSHALLKTAAKGEYRIQSIYGGAEQLYLPSQDEITAGNNILSYLDTTPLYARVDLLRGLDGQLKLIELEMIEPYLYLPFSGGEAGENKGAQRLAAALLGRL